MLTPWERIAARWLHAIPLLATVEVALGVYFAGVYGDIAANYYIFIGLFAAYAFATRRVVAAYVALASAASCLRLLYPDPHVTETIARLIVKVIVLVVVAAIVTLLREQLGERQRELEVLATHDPLTGVGNYRLLADRLQYEIVRHRRSGGSLTVMLLDLDGFKEVNDTLGHLAGDRVLREVAASLSAALRSQDTLARQGGDEFSILAPDTTAEQAAHLAARARQAVRDATGGSLSTSIGWVSSQQDGRDAHDLLALADANLRSAKQAQYRERPARHLA
jgi:diguanylate cyclase (GGDEF)-like protein